MHPCSRRQGRVRFNPNLYANGKVCLSTLGTWSGPSWSPALSLAAVLISIQSLMTESPYTNEPGYETVGSLPLPLSLSPLQACSTNGPHCLLLSAPKRWQDAHCKFVAMSSLSFSFAYSHWHSTTTTRNATQATLRDIISAYATRPSGLQRVEWRTEVPVTSTCQPLCRP